MDLEDLPEELQEMVEGLKHGSNTIECDVIDALENAETLIEFKENALNSINDLISEAEGIKEQLQGEKAHVVIHLFQGILEKVVVHRKPDKAKKDWEKRVVEAYGGLVDEQHGDNEILMMEAEVVE